MRLRVDNTCKNQHFPCLGRSLSWRKRIMLDIATLGSQISVSMGKHVDLRCMMAATQGLEPTFASCSDNVVECFSVMLVHVKMQA